MNIVAQHRITDPEKFFSMNAEEVAGGGPRVSRGGSSSRPRTGR